MPTSWQIHMIQQWWCRWWAVWWAGHDITDAYALKCVSQVVVAKEAVNVGWRCWPWNGRRAVIGVTGGLVCATWCCGRDWIPMPVALRVSAAHTADTGSSDTVEIREES